MRRAHAALGIGALVGLCAVLMVAAPAVAAGRASSPRPLRDKCGSADGIRAAPFWLRDRDGTRLYAFETGGGRIGVVLAHESPADLCGWLPYARTLAAAGVRVLAFDFRGFGDSERPPPATALDYGRDLRAAVTRLHADGASKVFLVGASFGGAAALTYAPTLPIAGVVSLSGEAHLPNAHLDALSSVPRLRAPLLIVGSRFDGYLPVSDALSLLRHAGSRDKHTAFYPGNFHGWEIVENAPYARKARSLILAWLEHH